MTNTLNLKRQPFINEVKIKPYVTGKLDGLSFTVKDNIDIAHQITRYGSDTGGSIRCLRVTVEYGATDLLMA